MRTVWLIAATASLCGLCVAEEPAPDNKVATSVAAPETKAEQKQEPEADIPPADIHAAAKSGNLEAVKKFLSADPKLVNARTQLKDTPLHWTASCKQPAVAKYLLSQGAEVDARNYTGKTPLHLATFCGDLETAAILLENKADVNAKAESPDDDESTGDTPLHIAARRGNVKMVELLIEKKADLNALNIGGKTPADLAKKLQQTAVTRLLRKSGARDTDQE
ncbi:MAG TPA: ankyrin repeat domain-containing protein [Planctomycetota bacterium]|jgi:ankyrin repeat protein